jgi:hypothetical protein
VYKIEKKRKISSQGVIVASNSMFQNQLKPNLYKQSNVKEYIKEEKPFGGNQRCRMYYSA